MQRGQDFINGQSDHYHMYVGFAFFFDLVLVSLMHLCLFIIYKYSPSNRSSNGGLWGRFAKLAKVYVSKNGIFSLFHFSLIDLIFLDSKVILISLGIFPNH